MNTARALEWCELLVMSRQKYEQLEQLHPALANLFLKWMLNSLSGRLHNALQRLAAIY